MSNRPYSCAARARHGVAGVGGLLSSQRLMRRAGRLGAGLLASLGLAAPVLAGMLPEPVIDPNMGAGPAAAQPAGPAAAPPPGVRGAMPQRQLSVQAPRPVAAAASGAASQDVPASQPPNPTILQSDFVKPAPRSLPAAALPPPSALETSLQERLQMLAMAGARQVAPTQARVEVEIGRLDPRLKLAPCEQIQPYLPPNQRMWGRTRIGIRCLSGPTRWNVSLPLTIRVFAPAYVAAADLPAGTLLTQEQLRLAETDIAGEAGVIYTQPDAWVGRHLAKGVMAGEALRAGDLKLRQWVQPGDRVQVQAKGQGFAMSGEGQAMGVGLEGQEVRIRFDNGRMVMGRTVGERKVEVLL